MNSSTLRRLASDHAALHKKELPPYYLMPAISNATSSDLTQLNVLITGPPGTPYEDGMWKLQLKMPADYPKSPPRAFFRTKMWHPNVEESTGSVCLDTLKRDWDPKLTLRDILVTISCLLINPNPDSALNASAGQLVQTNWDEFRRYAKLMSSIHAKIPAGLKEAAAEARTRGEEQKPLDTDSTIYESDYEEENTKENDVCLSLPVRESRPMDAIRRPTVLGKRPLADLPVPMEPPSDDEDEPTSSARNISANTPNLSNSLASVSFDSSVPAWANSVKPAEPKLVERLHSINTPEQSTILGQSERPAKRMCPGDGKENLSDAGKGLDTAKMPLTSGNPSGVVGLGLKTPLLTSGAGLTGRKIAPLGAGPAKSKPRVGMRRL